MKDYYKILEIAEDADPEQIKKSYRRLAKKYHPDTSKEEDAENKFKDISEAYAVLSNPDERKRYDFEKNHKPPPPPPGGFDNPIMNQFVRFHRAQQQAQVQPIHINLFLTLEEFHTGVSKHLKIHRSVPCNKCKATGSKSQKPAICPVCNGAGVLSNQAPQAFGFALTMDTCYSCLGSGHTINDPCSDCGGRKYETKEHEFDVHIAVGHRPEEILVLHEGHIPANTKSMRAGPVLIHLLAKPHPVYHGIVGNSLYMNHELDLYDALLGSKLELQTIDGKRINITIPPRKHYISHLQVEKQGISIDANTRGDLLINLTTRFPELTPEEKSALEEIRSKKHG